MPFSHFHVLVKASLSSKHPVSVYTFSGSTNTGMIPICSQNKLSSSWHETTQGSTRKHAFEILVHVDMIASHNCHRFVTRLGHAVDTKL